MIDALFGSKTRVKLLHLFLNNPGKAFYVREITRLIDEQINSVRRELANMLQVGIIDSDTADNKLYYSVNEKYEYYPPFRAIFSNDASSVRENSTHLEAWQDMLPSIRGLKIAVLAGALIKGSGSKVDVLLVGHVASGAVKKLIKALEQVESREVNYAVLSYEEFYYRLSVRDRFITEILNGKHNVLFDSEKILH